MERSAERQETRRPARRAPAEVGVFKSCPSCGWRWPTRESFLADPDIVQIGYMVNFKQLELGLIHFNHAPCRSTLAISAARFTDLYDGPIFLDRRTRSADCPAFCFQEHELRGCDAPCECAYVRAVLDLIARWPKAVPAD